MWSSSRSKTQPCPRCRENGKDAKGDNLHSYPNGHFHCFACGYHKFPRHYIPPEPKFNHVKASLPFDFTREVPARSLKWLLQFGLPFSCWQEHIGYSPSEESLVFPQGTFSVGRYVGEDDKPKWQSWGDCHARCVLFGQDFPGPIVLVEDLVSAHKVGQVAHTVPLFGSKPYPRHLNYLRQQKKPVVLWLDKDQEGLNYKKAATIQTLTGCNTSCVTTNKDPKNLNILTIKEHL